jgi:hypothetical protein
LVQFRKTRVSVDVWLAGTVPGLKENWLMAIPLVHAALNCKVAVTVVTVPAPFTFTFALILSAVGWHPGKPGPP